jgi:TRAP-type mannitol/chloroaromatic compound transport system permease large subunit
VVPPSLVLIVVAEQLGVSVGEMYAAALVPAALLTGLYALLVAVLAAWHPEWMPPLPPQRRTLVQADGSALDFFEIAFVLLPLLAPVAHKLGIDLVWFGILVGVNLQASFMTPPFGFSLFFLRGVAPGPGMVDPGTGQALRGITTNDIYIGVLPFVAVQLLVLGLLIGWPELVMRESQAVPLDAAAIERALEGSSPPDTGQETDPVQLLLDSLRGVR